MQLLNIATEYCYALGYLENNGTATILTAQYIQAMRLHTKLHKNISFNTFHLTDT